MSCKLSKANFMRCLAPQGNWQATDLHSMEQVGREHLMENKHRADEFGRGGGGFPSGFPIGEDDWQKRRFALDYLERRKERGGQTMRPWDAVQQYRGGNDSY